MIIDAIELEVVKASLSGIVQEMQKSLFRTGFSTIVRESQDASCALMDAAGEVVAQHVVLPLHIGAFPASTAAVIAEYRDDIAAGDAFIINHPYHGGSPHAPDIAIITPVFVEGALFGSAERSRTRAISGAQCRAAAPGRRAKSSMRACTFPPCATSAVQANADIERLIGANSRTPELVLGDIRGQLGADRLGEQRVTALAGKLGAEKIRACCDRLLALSQARLKAAIAEWADGRFEAERFVDDDGMDLEGPCACTWRSTSAVTAPFRLPRLRRSDHGTRQYPAAAGAGRLRLRADLADRPVMHVSSGLLRGLHDGARGQRAQSALSAPVNTYNPTIHALVDAMFDA